MPSRTDSSADSVPGSTDIDPNATYLPDAGVESNPSRRSVSVSAKTADYVPGQDTEPMDTALTSGLPTIYGYRVIRKIARGAWVRSSLGSNSPSTARSL